MSYELITVYEVYQSDTGNLRYEKHICYCATKIAAKEAAGPMYDISPREAILVDGDIWLLANGIGYNKPIEMSGDATY